MSNNPTFRWRNEAERKQKIMSIGLLFWNSLNAGHRKQMFYQEFFSGFDPESKSLCSGQFGIDPKLTAANNEWDVLMKFLNQIMTELA